MDDQDDSRDPIADYIEWTQNRYNPGYFLGGRIRPELRKARLSPRGRRLSAALLAIEGLMSLALSIGYIVTMSFSWEGVPSVGFGVLYCSAAVTMFKPLEPR